jgi:hypothetical protein
MVETKKKNLEKSQLATIKKNTQSSRVEASRTELESILTVYLSANPHI